MSAGDGYRSELRSKAVLALANAASFPFSEGLRELVQASDGGLYELFKKNWFGAQGVVSGVRVDVTVVQSKSKLCILFSGVVIFV